MPRSGGGAAAGRAGESWGRGASGEPGWAQRCLPSPSPLAVAPYFKAIPARPPVPCPDVLEPSRPRGLFSVLSPTQNPEPKPKKEPLLLSPLPSSRPNHIPRLLCEITQQEALSHSAFHGWGP